MSDPTTDEIEQLRAALRDAVEGMAEMLPYVPDYFRWKWGLDSYLARGIAARDRLAPTTHSAHAQPSP